MTPTPSAPTAEMLAFEILAYQDLLEQELRTSPRDEAKIDELRAAHKEAVAALARSEPPTEGKIQAVATPRQPIVPSVLMWQAAYMAWAKLAEWWDFDSEGCACNRKSAGTMAFAAWNGARAALTAAPVATDRDSLLPASQPSEPPTGEPVAEIVGFIRNGYREWTLNPKAPLWEITKGRGSVENVRLNVYAEARAPGAVPEGCRLVPIEPTEAMHAAAVRTIVRCSGNDDFPPRVYRAMLAAAPPIEPQAVASRIDAVDSVQEPKPEGD